VSQLATNASTNASLHRQLYNMTWPMLFGVLSLMTFQLTDSAFIGQLGRDPLAALGFTIPMQQLVSGMYVGLGIATTAVISRTLGQNDSDSARQLGGLVVLIGATLVLVLCLLVWFGQQPILTLLGAEPELWPLIRQYWAPWLVAAWTGAMVYFGYSLCRSRGDTKLPGAVMVATSLLNVGLDWLYIFYLVGACPARPGLLQPPSAWALW